MVAHSSDQLSVSRPQSDGVGGYRRHDLAGWLYLCARSYNASHTLRRGSLSRGIGHISHPSRIAAVILDCADVEGRHQAALAATSRRVIVAGATRRGQTDRPSATSPRADWTTRSGATADASEAGAPRSLGALTAASSNETYRPAKINACAIECLPRARERASEGGCSGVSQRVDRNLRGSFQAPRPLRVTRDLGLSLGADPENQGTMGDR